MRIFNYEQVDETSRIWVLKFRRSKSLNTLDLMVDKAEREHKADRTVLDAINLAWCVREQEIKNGKLI
ncbi:hypothetical protein AYI95_08400 [Shewanella xiamenensis]|nr:hypothetical protein AYI95_08400 [Shewanella xiamenensis]